MNLLETIKEVSALSKAIHEYKDREIAARFPNYPFIKPEDEEPPLPPEEGQLRALLASLPEETVYALSLVERIGQYGLGTDRLPELYAEVKGTMPDRRLPAARLVNNPYLSEDFAEGIERLERGGHDVNHLPLSPAAVGT
jgi:hypothetical protein